MDDADRADGRIQEMIEAGMARAKAALERRLPSTGQCHWCFEPVEGGRLFCCRECSDDHEADRLARKRNGC